MGALVCATMKAYKLDPMCGVFVEYYSCSMGSYMQSDYLFSESAQHVQHLIAKDDLWVKESSLILLLRFRNCTGNIIELTKEPIENVDQDDVLSGHLVLT